MMKILLIALFGGVGSVLRFLVSGLGQKLTVGTFPVGTLIVNVAGCFLIGVVNAVLLGRILGRPEYRFAIVVGLLGGFTTFSSFAWESFSLASDGQFLRASANVLLSVALGLLAVWIGFRTASVLFGIA